MHSDHKPLEMIHLKNLSAAPPRLQRMLLRLQGYFVTIRYKPGKEMLLADAMSRLNPMKSPGTVESVMKVNFVNFSENRLTILRQATRDDPEMAALQRIIADGWPERQRDVAQPLRKYWSYRDELSIEDGIIIKGDRIVVPQACRRDILNTIHEGHLGITKCQLRAKTSVFWHNINKDIEGIVKSCPQCQEHGKTQPRKPLQPHEIPTGPWQVLGTDIFTLYGEDYLLTVDYYSKYPIIRRLPSGQSTSQNVITFLKQTFSEHGIPLKLISDNGSQYSSHLFNEFARTWGFQHITSSPTYPQSNGFAERFVQTIKNIVGKTMKNKGDVYLSLLSFRSTPVDHDLPSPAELLFNRKIRSTLPTRTPNKNPQRDHIAERLQHRQTTQKNYFDNRSTSRAPLIPDQYVYVQQQTGKKRWEPAQVHGLARRTPLVRDPYVIWTDTKT